MQLLRVQITLTSGHHIAATPAGQESTRTISASGRRLRVTFTPEANLIPGGPAVHGTLKVTESDGMSFLPPGSQFELWDNGRIGYGSVLAWW